MQVNYCVNILNNENEYSLNECQKAVEYCICNNLINDDLIEKYKPFNVWKHFCSIETYQYIIDKFSFLKYSVIKAVVMAGYNEIYFNNKIEPEIEIFRTAAKCANKLVYLDQLEKAKYYGFFFKFLDIKNKKIINSNPEKIPLSEVNIELEFDYNIYLEK